MAKEEPQTFENHARRVPVFIVGNLVLLVNLGVKLYDLRHGVSFGAVMDVLVAAALIALFFFARQSTLTVQNRLVRLEMRLRLARLLPADFQQRIPEFTLDQLASLRFASDAELPGLARKVFDDKITERNAIKRMVKDWQADTLRA
ncbi:MAG TPA: DUF6526 family protein [Candidatus Dormibacteraeota bacterium]|nr:DUF6526 family protein [Candidatus Dormibacteraeota bacterium]